MKNYLKECLFKMNIEISEDKLLKFIKYSELLLDWNTKINLTAITEPDEIVKKHFCDSLSSLPLIKQGASLADVGTGAGFPGIPLAIARDDINVYLIDSLNKRIKFLEEVIYTLGLYNVKAVHMRAEDGAKGNLRDSFDVVTARAVAPLNVLCEYCLPYVKPGGLFLAYKGEKAKEELVSAQNAIEKLCAEAKEIYTCFIPDSSMSHNIIPVLKKCNTPKTYPRTSAKISKSPL
ncbi:MAG: 16S rRNA (guanine(527)-N(7))-methyltransferase RsmG [Ruminococcaceae bacterium]|nr:16S rRNA (guanine(527)-N(7))-methyltransferase RsmG [Oscillospiraceae bacterium]